MGFKTKPKLLNVVDCCRKLSAMKTAAFFDKARQEANLDTFWRILNRKGGEPPCEDDEL